MKVLLTGGSGTGGHFYPLIAVARALKNIAAEEHIIKMELFWADEKPFDPNIIAEEQIELIKISSGKFPRYASVQNIISPFKILFGFFMAFWKLYFLLPDIIFSKGGFSAFPVLLAARILKIPVIIHESDSVPGKVNKWSGKWADRIAISFQQTAEFFKSDRVAVTGNPIRQQVVGGNLQEAIETFNLEERLPTMLILGGSQGAEQINEVVLDMLQEAVTRYQIIHQTGKILFNDVVGRAGIILEKSDFKHRYHPYPFLEESNLRNASKAASIVVSRAGSAAIFEAAAWQLPAILIPLQNSAQDHQRENAYVYARFGACEVIEGANLKPHILLSAIDKILQDQTKKGRMIRAAQEFARLDAAKTIAKEIIMLGVHD